ncbi:MAG: dihydroorotate dehydrogenase electron transfer subunit [Firmicutes bacterium]|nr:dihydroorotate dehydrogenase electron transfer subunit [Bacillota bacterium]
MTLPIIHLCEVLINREVKPGFYELRLHAPMLAKSAAPGQFAMLQCAAGKSTDPLLRRPLSFSNVCKKTGSIVFLYQVKGKGTHLLSRISEGDYLDVMGPLGTGFKLPKPGTPIAVIGCGIGVAPLIYMADYGRKHGHDVYAFIAARSKDSLLGADTLTASCACVYTATDDGSHGVKGNITDLLDEAAGTLALCKTTYICGPWKAMAVSAEKCLGLGLACQVSLESIMACGIGACLGCTCKTTRHIHYTRVCTEGPVFQAEEVLFDA